LYNLPYNVVMESTTISQFVSDNVEGDPAFKGYVVCELKDLIKQNPTMTLSELLQDATESALEEWDRDQSYEEW